MITFANSISEAVTRSNKRLKSLQCKAFRTDILRSLKAHAASANFPRFNRPLTKILFSSILLKCELTNSLVSNRIYDNCYEFCILLKYYEKNRWEGELNFCRLHQGLQLIFNKGFSSFIKSFGIFSQYILTFYLVVLKFCIQSCKKINKFEVLQLAIWIN